MIELDLWTDGSCNNNKNHQHHGKGGWAFLVIENGEIVHEDLGAKKGTTSSRMEQTAVLEGMKFIYEFYAKKNVKINIYTDSQFIVNTFREKWFMRWQEMDFYNIKNDDLWKKILKIYNISRLKFFFFHVRGHTGIPNNERVDYLAGEARKTLLN